MIACGEGAGWRQAGLLYSLDDGASWIAAPGTAAPGIIGSVATPPADASPWIVDRRSRLVVTLQRDDMLLGDADAASLAQQTNVALVGDELIQFERAEPLGGRRWAVTGLRRGMRGTEGAIGTQTAGDRFALIERDAVVSIDLPDTTIGRAVRLLASGVGDVVAPAAATVRVAGTSVVPPAPVHLAVRVAGDGTRRLMWVRRSRAGWGWSDGLDAPLVEEAERYRVTIAPDGGPARVVEVDRPELSLGEDDRPAWVTVVQSGTFGTSPPARLRIA